MAATARSIAVELGERVRTKWEDLEDSELNSSEKALRVSHILENTSQLHLQKYLWMTGKVGLSGGTTLKFSRWEKRGKLMHCEDSEFSRPEIMGPPHNLKQSRKIAVQKMLCFQDEHFYTREGGLS